MRVNITVEGQTEQGFVKKVLAPYLADHGVYASARSVLTSKDKKAHREYRGGFRRGRAAYATVWKDIQSWMKEDKQKDVCFTTMFDLYGLPDAFPKRKETVGSADIYEKVHTLETAFNEDIRARLKDDPRFFSYLQLHEFEALLLADPEKLLLEYVGQDRAVQNLLDLVERVGGEPERINDSPETAPSKRIIHEIPAYENGKTTTGVLVAELIGMETLLGKCPHFRSWVEQLVALGREVR